MATPNLANKATASRNPKAPNLSITVITYNIHHGEGLDGKLRLQRVTDIIHALNADIVGLQEVDNHWSERSEFIDEAAVLASKLNMHRAYAANVDMGPLRPGQAQRQYGTAILSKHPILKSHNTLLPNLEGSEQRGLLEAVINVRGTPVHFCNTHLQQDSANQTSGQVQRTAQAKMIVDIMGQTEGSIVLTGDFNAEPGSPELAPLYDRFNNVWEKTGEGPGYTHPSSNPRARIDHIFVSHGLYVSSASVPINNLTRVASDHLPLVANLLVSNSDSGIGS